MDKKVAVVTGATAGIGKAIAQEMAKNGMSVVLIGTNEERGLRAVEEIQALSGTAVFMPVDVSLKSEVDRAVQKIVEQFGRVDVLVNNAGITRDGLLMKMSEQDWDQVMDVNAKSCFNFCQALCRQMMKQRSGKIINISSVVGLIGNVGQANYAASKAAIIGFTKALAKELSSRNICVNCIAPGFIQTSMTEQLSDNIKEDLLKNIPLKRFGSPQEIANLALFLSSDLSDYITGQVIAVDGGMSI